MNDKVLLDAFYWLMMNRDFIQITSAIFSFIALLISLILITKRWGDSY